MIQSLKKTLHYLYDNLVRDTGSTIVFEGFFLKLKGKIVETDKEEEVLLALGSARRHKCGTTINLCIYDFFSLISISYL